MSIISRLVIPPGNKSMVGTCVNVVVVVYVVFDEGSVGGLDPEYSINSDIFPSQNIPGVFLVAPILNPLKEFVPKLLLSKSCVFEFKYAFEFAPLCKILYKFGLVFNVNDVFWTDPKAKFIRLFEALYNIAWLVVTESNKTFHYFLCIGF
jgi:hypothetical protein